MPAENIFIYLNPRTVALVTFNVIMRQFEVIFQLTHWWHR